MRYWGTQEQIRNPPPGLRAVKYDKDEPLDFMSETAPLYVQYGLRKPLKNLVIVLIVLFVIIISTSVDKNLSGFALFFGFGTAILALVNYIFLLLSKDYEFHGDYLKVIKFDQKTENIPYWMIQHSVQSSNPLKKDTRKSFVLQLKVRRSGEVMNIKDNPFNGEIKAQLREFLLNRTAPIT